MFFPFYVFFLFFWGRQEERIVKALNLEMIFSSLKGEENRQGVEP